MSVLRSAAKLAFATADLFLRSPSGPRILIYHQVGAGLGRQMEVSVEDFEWQLDWLVDNREVVDLDTALRRWNEPGSDRLVVLTFDDGYRDTYSTAFPLLMGRSLPFTVYLATEMIESGSPLTGLEHDRPLTWSMVREIVESGLVTIGAHTHTHRDLRGLDRDEIEAELSMSDELIATNVGSVPRHFAYPWGYWSPNADKLVRARYVTAVLGASPNPDPDAQPHCLHRFPVQMSDGTRFFGRRLRGGLLSEELVRRWLRGYRGP